MEVLLGVIIILVMLFISLIAGVLIALLLNVVNEVKTLKEIFNRIYRIEGMVQSLVMDGHRGEIDTEDFEIGESVLFKTKDGRYSASSPEGLIELLRQDPSYNLTPEEESNLIDSMQKFKDRYVETDEDEEDDVEPWKK